MRTLIGSILILLSFISLISMISEGARTEELVGALTGFVILTSIGGCLIYSSQNKK